MAEDLRYQVLAVACCCEGLCHGAKVECHGHFHEVTHVVGGGLAGHEDFLGVHFTGQQGDEHIGWDFDRAARGALKTRLDGDRIVFDDDRLVRTTLDRPLDVGGPAWGCSGFEASGEVAEGSGDLVCTSRCGSRLIKGHDVVQALGDLGGRPQA